MAGAQATTDVWGRTAEIDESALAVMAARLENRAKHPFFRGVIADYIGDLEPERIERALEIGCGTGVVSRTLAAAPGFHGTIKATDVSAYLIEAARRHAAREGVDTRIAFEVDSAAKLHAEEAAYDLVIAHTLFSHASDPVAILAECARVLSPRGRLVIFDRTSHRRRCRLGTISPQRSTLPTLPAPSRRSLSSCVNCPRCLPTPALPSNRIGPMSLPMWGTPNSSPRIFRRGAGCYRFPASSPRTTPIG